MAYPLHRIKLLALSEQAAVVAVEEEALPEERRNLVGLVFMLAAVGGRKEVLTRQ